MVINIYPIAHLLSFAINRDGLFFYKVSNYDWNKFFWILIGSKVITRVRQCHLSIISFIIRHYEMICTRFRSGIGRIWPVRSINSMIFLVITRTEDFIR